MKILDELERLQSEATPGPYERAEKPLEFNRYIIANSRWNYPEPLPQPDADYIVTSLNILPALIRVARAAEYYCRIKRSAMSTNLDIICAEDELHKELRKLGETE